MIGVVLVTAALAGSAPCDDLHLSFHRERGRTVGVLKWQRPSAVTVGARYRVLRDGRVVGQTTRRSMRVRVRLGRRYRMGVQAVGVPGCAAVRRIRVRVQPPGRPRRLVVSRNAAGTKVRLAWARARRGDLPIAGYRVFRGSTPLGQSHARRRAVRIASNRRYSFSVAAVDTRGRVGPRAKPVVVDSGHVAPSPPARVQAVTVSESEVGLRWQPSRSRRSRIVGYRILRNGVVWRQVRGTTITVTGLAPATTYRFQVQAVDGLGYASVASPAVHARTNAPAPTGGHAHAYVLASTDKSFADLRAHYRQIGTIYPTYYDCTEGAELTGRDDPLITRWSTARRIAVLPRVNCQSTATLTRILRDAATRARWLSQLVALVDSHGFDGLSLDFEAGAPSDRDAYTSFVADLAERLHARGKHLSIAVSAKTRDDPRHARSGIFDYPALARYADYVVVMAWGVHWSTSGPGAIDELGWVTAVADYVAGLDSRRKFLLGSHLYAMDWAAGAGSDAPAEALEHADALQRIAATGASVELDARVDAYHARYRDGAGVAHDLWYGDAATLARRIRLAQARGLGGVTFWRLGREDQRLWNDALLAPGVAWR